MTLTHENSVTHTDTPLDVGRVRESFPILHTQRKGKPLVYLDNAATTQKPQCVIDAVSRYYESQNSNVHRGIHYLSERATEMFEGARDKVRRFINATSVSEIIYTRGTTESINLVANSYGRSNVGPGDEVLVTHMEHHSNIVPWQVLCEEKGAALRVVPISDEGELDMAAFDELLSDRTKIVAVTHVSNALGTVNRVREIIRKAHAADVPVLVDGAQAAPHMRIDVQDLDCDFYALSGHKMFGPTGIGILYGKEHLLEAMPPYQCGGDMILSVSFEKTIYNKLPYKFEAGTPNIAGAAGLGAAVDYLQTVGMERIHAYEQELLAYGMDALSGMEGIRFVGTARDKAGVISFHLDDIHPHDIGQLLDEDGVAIRAGHHCAQPTMKRFGLAATSRASFAFYNLKEEFDALAAALRKAREVFA
ncbi:MAG: SufS family cysteine desulfurase [Candidatus Hydrogenedentota bacterium]